MDRRDIPVPPIQDLVIIFCLGREAIYMDIFQGSLAVRAIKNIARAYNNLESGFDKIYQNSRIHKILKRGWQRTKTNFRDSFLGRITEINDQPNPAILENSAVVKKVSRLFYSWQDKITICSKTSSLVDNVQGLKKELYFSPVQTGSFIVLGAIATNIILSLLLHKEINTLGWIIRISLLTASWGGLSSQVQWEELKKTSLVVDYLGRRQRS